MRSRNIPEREYRSIKARRCAVVVPSGKSATDPQRAATAYLPTVRAMPSYKSRKRQVALWVEALGETRLPDLTHVMIAAQLQRWATEPRSDEDDAEPYSPQYCVHLRTALAHLWTTLYPDAENPVARVPRLPTPEPAVRAIPALALARLQRQFRPGSKNRARLAVMATTGRGRAGHPTDASRAPRAAHVRAARRVRPVQYV